MREIVDVVVHVTGALAAFYALVLFVRLMSSPRRLQIVPRRGQTT